jgi:hypothetical protein
MIALRILAITLALASCTKRREEPAEIAVAAKPDQGVLRPIKVEDAVGYLSGNYHTISNNPAIFADGTRFVMMGKQYRKEVAFADRDRAFATFEQLLLDHGYAANGKPAPDRHQKVMVDGKEMVVVQMGELFPEMPAELKARFTAAQLAVLDHTTTTDGYRLFSGHDPRYAPHPVIYASSKQLTVVGPGTEKSFPIERATEAFTAYRALLDLVYPRR